MTDRENYLSLISRKGYERVPVEFSMCSSLSEKFYAYLKENELNLEIPRMMADAPDLSPKTVPTSTFMKYYDVDFKAGTNIDSYGIAHEPGSKYAYHMTKMYHPMSKFDSVEQVLAYELPDFSNCDSTYQKETIAKLHDNDKFVIGNMAITIWEISWYLRGMENLMMDMLSDEEMAAAILDRNTENACIRAKSFAESGCDALLLGDDIGMQHSIMMSVDFHSEWLKPRLKKVINSAKSVNPNIKIFYHSCGYVKELIPNLIEAGIDILNPVQPECMKFEEIYEMFGDRLSFHGTIGTQTTMPFGTPEEVRREVFKNLDIAGKKGGLIPCPTHLLEPEVPVENVIAYINACKEYTN